VNRGIERSEIQLLVIKSARITSRPNKKYSKSYSCRDNVRGLGRPPCHAKRDETMDGGEVQITTDLGLHPIPDLSGKVTREISDQLSHNHDHN